MRGSIHEWQFPARLSAPVLRAAQLPFRPNYSQPASRNHPSPLMVQFCFHGVPFPSTWTSGGNAGSSPTVPRSGQFVRRLGHRLRWEQRAGREDCDFWIGPIGYMWPTKNSPRHRPPPPL